MKPTVMLHAALLKHAANLRVPGTEVFHPMNKIPRSVAAGGLAMGAAGAAASTALPGYNAAHGGDKITAENLKRLGDNNAKMQTDLVQGHSKIPGGDPRDSDFIDAKQRSDTTRNSTGWDQIGKDVQDLQSKGFSPEFAAALGNTKGLGRARQTIDAQENMERSANKARLEHEILTGVNPNQDELRARVGQAPIKKHVAGPEIGADQEAVMAELEKQIADQGPVDPGPAPALPDVAEKKPVEVPSAEPAKAEPEVAKADLGAGIPLSPPATTGEPSEAVAAKTGPGFQPGPAPGPAVASRVGGAMDPRNEDLSPAPPAPADTTVTTDTTKPPAEPGFMDRLGSGATAAMDWAKANPALAAGGVGAVGLLAYLLSKNDAAPAKKRRRLVAA